MLADRVQKALVSLEICQNGKKSLKLGKLERARGFKATVDVLSKDLLFNITDQLN